MDRHQTSPQLPRIHPNILQRFTPYLIKLQIIRLPRHAKIRPINLTQTPSLQPLPIDQQQRESPTTLVSLPRASPRLHSKTIERCTLDDLRNQDHGRRSAD